MQIGDLSGINWVSEVNSKVICQIFCLIKGSVASRCNVVIRKLLVQYLQAFLFFYCFAFLNTSKLLLIFNFLRGRIYNAFISCCFCPKIYCPYLLSFSFFWISFFYFHDVECMCIKRRDTYDQWIVAETCTFLILFLFVKQFATLFSMEEVQLETLISAWSLIASCIAACFRELDSPSEIVSCIVPKITVIKRKQSVSEKV